MILLKIVGLVQEPKIFLNLLEDFIHQKCLIIANLIKLLINWKKFYLKMERRRSIKMRNFKSLDDKIDFFEQGFKKYCFSLGADSISIKEIPDYSYNYSELAIRSYIKLRERYDFGIGLARGGLWHSYIFHTLGLPTFIVQTKRKRSSIVWRPLHDISSPDLLNKR